MKKNYLFIFFLLSLLMASCAGGWKNLSSVDEGQVIETDVYSITIPKGHGWTCRVNHSQGFVVLQKANPQGNTTSVSVLRGWINQALAEAPGDSFVSSVILDGELRNMESRGRNKYYITENLKTFLVVGDKRFHMMSYEIVDYSQQVDMHVEYKMFIYLPPDFRSRKIYYTFLVGEPFRIGNVEYETHLTIIDYVIESFREK